jgi:osmotically-inducible protein OsmY
MTNDRELHRHIEGALAHDRRIHLPQSALKIAVDDGFVTLQGTVPSVAAKRLALRLAGAVPGVRGVEDRTRVAIVEAMGDLECLDHLRRSLVQERNIEEQKIVLSADPEGGVLLEGEVHALVQRRLAEVLAWWIPGVSNVDNRIVVNPPETDSNEELRDNLEVIFDKDVLVDRSQIRALVRDGVVTLRGLVRNENEKDAAEQDCWYTPGVIDVANELRVS